MRGFFAGKPAESWAAALAGIALILLILIVGSPDRLDSGLPLRRFLAGGESHLYRLSLRRSDLWQLTLVVRQGEVRARVFDPLGRRIVDLKSNQIPGSSELALGRAAAEGEYQVEISSTQPIGRQGSYEIQARIESGASGADRLRWQAGASALHGRKLLQDGEDPSKAAANLRRAAWIWQKVGDPSQQAAALFLWAEAEMARGDPSAALGVLAQAMVAYTRAGLDFGRAEVLAARARAFTALEDKQAIDSWKKAGDAFATLRNFAREAVCRIEEGRLHHGKGNFEKARQCYLRAEELTGKEINHREFLTVRGNLANLADNTGDPEEALEIIADTRRQVGRDELLLLQAEALIYLNQRNFVAAKDAIRKVIERAAGDPIHQAFGYNLKGNWYAHQGDYPSAKRAYEVALQWARRSRNSIEIGNVLGNLGNSAFRSGNYARALELYSEILEIYRASEDRFNQAATHINLARSYNAIGKRDSERAALQQARALIEELRGEPRNLAFRVKSLRGLQGLYGSLVTYLWEKKETKCAFEVAEASRARALLDEWSPEVRGADEPIDVPCLDQAPRESLPEIHRLLGPRTALLSFKLDETRIYAWWIDDSDIAQVEIPLTSNQVEALTTRIHNHLKGTSGDNSKGIAAAKELSGHLFGHFTDRMGRIERLLIVADGSLQYIPFPALPDPRDGKPLLERLEISSIPSVTALMRLRAASSPRAYSKDLAIFAEASFDRRGDWRDLPHTRLEAEGILALFPGQGRTRAFLGPQASVSRFLNEDLSGYRYLHVATHGFFNRATPEASGLVLSELDALGRPVPSSVLYPEQIAGRRLNAELVVLSACETGLANVAGEGMIGLPRAFLVAGAKRVLVSLWQVKDKATQELMVRFYGGLQRGLPPATALRQAQIQLSRTAGFEAPYNWAGFVLYGLP